MTVSSIVPVNNYAGNGSNTKFDFDFLIENANELVVTHITENKIKTVLTNGVDYSINETGNKNGSYITFPIAGSSFNTLQLGETISLSLNLEIKQESEFKNSSHLNLNLLEWTFDYIIRILQILCRKIERSIKVQEGLNFDTDELVANVNSIMENINNVNTVADSCTNINLVGNSISNVNDVANDLGNIDSASEYAANAEIWAEGTDEEVQQIGGTHSSKNWAIISQTVNADFINNSKALETDEVSDNATVYADVLKYAHSTFDISKFTFGATSNLTITDDGIASGFSSSNRFTYSYSPSLNFATDNFEFGFEFTTGTVSSVQNIIGFKQDYLYRPYIDMSAANNIFFRGVDSTETNFNFKLVDGNAAANTSYYFYFVVNNGTVTIYRNGSLIGTINDISSTAMVFNGFFTRFTSDNFVGTIDMKKLSIKVNGVPVFSGTKTGTDTVSINGTDTAVPYTLSKTRSKIVDVSYRTTVQNIYQEYGYAPYYTIDKVNKNYTLPMGEIYGMFKQWTYESPKIKSYGVAVKGSLTNNNGVLSGFSSGNYSIISGIFAPQNNSWEMNFKVTTGNSVSDEQEIFSDENNDLELELLGGKWALEIHSTNAQSGTHTVLADTTYYLRLKYNGSAFVLEYSLDGTTYTTDISYTTTKYAGYGMLYLGIDYNVAANPWGGTIDLNDCKIEIDNVLIWQGIGPQNNLYATDNKPAVITESYINGTYWYRLYSDGWCEQGGFEGIGSTDRTINFLKNYKDLNYHLYGTSVTNGSVNIGLIKNDETSFYYHIGNTNTSGFWSAAGYIL